MRTLPKDFDRAQARAVDSLLDKVRDEHNATILWAIESGSRAWGFPSPDSDYDCRFIYIRRTEDYLSPWPRRDVIETPLIDDLDVNGWDFGKTLKLVLKGNAVAMEWLSSPIVYVGFAEFRDDLLDFATRHANRDRVGRHYLHLGERQRRTYFGEAKSVELKKIFYAFRPAAALRWLRFHPDRAFPPMDFPTLMAECAPPHEVATIAGELVERKALTRELGRGSLPKPVARFIDDEFIEAEKLFEKRARLASPAAKAEAEELFRKWLFRTSEARA